MASEGILDWLQLALGRVLDIGESVGASFVSSTACTPTRDLGKSRQVCIQPNAYQSACQDA
eukprot:6188120-Pleurochrysis_carterae.AAC.1